MTGGPSSNSTGASAFASARGLACFYAALADGRLVDAALLADAVAHALGHAVARGVAARSKVGAAIREYLGQRTLTLIPHPNPNSKVRAAIRDARSRISRQRGVGPMSSPCQFALPFS